MVSTSPGSADRAVAAVAAARAEVDVATREQAAAAALLDLQGAANPFSRGPSTFLKNRGDH